MAFYVETSAAAKLVLEEPESDAIDAWLRSQELRPVASDLTRTELLRATRRFLPDRTREARQVLANLAILSLPRRTFDRAALVDPPELRSLDALHLAAALELGDELEGIVTYDERLAAAADRLASQSLRRPDPRCCLAPRESSSGASRWRRSGRSTARR